MATDLMQEIDTAQNTRLCPLYKVLIHNDSVTTVDFVLRILADVFHKQFGDAFDIMLHAHEHGLALVEVVSLERGEFHVEQAKSLARARKYPLAFTMEAA